MNRVAGGSSGLTSTISTKAALSGGSSGGRLSQARAVICNVPNDTVAPIGASIVEMRAVILSSPCRTAISAGAASAAPVVSAPARTIAAVLAPARVMPSARLAIGVVERIDEPAQHLAHLGLVAPHEDGVLQRVLRHLPDLLQVFVQDLDLLVARHWLAVGLPPGRKPVVVAALRQGWGPRRVRVGS